jgi:phenylacetic acid degradation operon negative regulatory protein
VTVTEKAGSNVAATRDANLRELIISLYGLYARTQNNWFSIAALVRLMGDLGADEPSVRSSIYRLKQRGVLDAVKVDSAAGYALSASSIQSFAEGDVRIFGRRRATVEDGWLLLVFSIPETQRDKRHELRTQLFRLNFGTAAPGTWIAPGNLHEETRDMLERHGLTNFVDIFRGDHLAFGDLRTKVQSWWEFDELTQAYDQFITKYRPILKRFSNRRYLDQDAFIEYMHMLTSWRRIPDPRLPPEVLPKGWNGLSGSALFAELNELLKEPARRHALEAVHRSGAG